MNAGPTSLRVRRRQSTHAEIVRTAFELFARHGYEAVSVDDIAAGSGVSRATFFNYFPRKDAILLEIAQARAARLKMLLDELRASSRAASIAEVVELMLKLTRENAKIALASKELLIQVFCAHVSRGLLLPAREEAVQALAGVLRTMSRRRTTKPELVAETIFAVFLTTMLEWLMRKDAPQRWLVGAMRARLELVVEGAR